MSLDRSFHFPAIWILVGVGERYKPVDTVMSAAGILLQEWPSVVGSAYLNALQVCLDALQGRRPTDAVPEALMKAADEAFVSYIHVIGGRSQPHSPQMRASRAGHAIPKTPLMFGYKRPHWLAL